MSDAPCSSPFLIDAAALAMPWSGPDLPLAFVDLSAVDLGCGSNSGTVHLPPFPIIALGASSYPWAAAVDCVIEPPFTWRQLERVITAQPQAAAILVDVLRAAAQQPSATSALITESLAYAVLQASASHDRWLAETALARSKGNSAGGAVHIARDGDVLAVTIARPDALNAINCTLRDALREAFDLAAMDDAIHRVVLSAEGRAFSIGADLAEFGTTRDPALAHTIRMRSLPAHALARCGQKVAVVIRGACIGAGLEMAAFATSITASRDAWFQLPELAMGILPGAGGTVSIPQRIGRQRAALLMLSGKRLSAAQAHAWGLVDSLIDA